MAGYMTQKRSFDVNHPWLAKDGSTTLTSGLIAMKSDQETTGFRSGRDALPDEPEEIPTTRQGAFRKFRREYKENQRPYDRGHTFDTYKREATFGLPKTVFSSANGRYRYEGGTYVVPSLARYKPTTGQNTFVNDPGFNSNYYGPLAIARTAPTNAVADLAVLLGELRKEGLPKLGGSDLLKHRSTRARESGSEYLNIEFGWKPLIAGLADTMHAVSESERIMKQYERDSGRWVRRSYSFPTETVETFTNSQRISPRSVLFRPVVSSVFWDNVMPSTLPQCSLTESVKITRRVWFSGAYSYHLPKIGDNSIIGGFRRHVQNANHVLGLRLTPEVLWNLQPWTWLADWDSNIGANITALTALSTDSLVIVYGYLMCETRTEHTFTVEGARHAGGIIPPFSDTYVTTRKRRVQATPYGFGQNPDSFSDRQWSILGALGLTKSPKKLRSVGL